MTAVAIFGLQRSGTNFAEQLVKRNVKGVSVSNTWRNNPLGIWKHSYDIDKKPKTAITLGDKGDVERHNKIGKEIKAWYIHKNPYSWIESICTKQVDIKKTYPRVAFNEKNDENAFDMKGLNLVRLVELYRDHTEYWYRMCHEKKIFHLSYEDLIYSDDSSRSAVNAFAEHYQLQCSRPRDVIIPQKVGQSDQFTEESRKKYNQVKLKLLDWHHIVKMNNILNHKLVAWQGYDLITTQEKFNFHKI
jgi:hypothetical protein